MNDSTLTSLLKKTSFLADPRKAPETKAPKELSIDTKVDLETLERMFDEFNRSALCEAMREHARSQIRRVEELLCAGPLKKKISFRLHERKNRYKEIADGDYFRNVHAHAAAGIRERDQRGVAHENPGDQAASGDDRAGGQD